MSVCAIQNLGWLQSALLGAANALEAGELLLTNPVRMDDEGLKLTGLLHGAIASVDGEWAKSFAEAGTAKAKAEVVHGLGSHWGRVQKHLGLLFQETEAVAQIVRENLQARAQKSDEPAEIGKRLASLVQQLYFANRNSKSGAMDAVEAKTNYDFLRSLKESAFDDEARRKFAHGFYQEAFIRILFGQPLNPWKSIHREAAAFAEMLLLVNILKKEDPDFAAAFLMEMEPKTPAEFFGRLADVLAQTGSLSSQLFGHDPKRKDWEMWNRDQAQLATFAGWVKAIRMLLREVDAEYSEGIDLFHARLREQKYPRASELMDMIGRRAQLARTAPSRNPDPVAVASEVASPA